MRLGRVDHDGPDKHEPSLWHLEMGQRRPAGVLHRRDIWYCGHFSPGIVVTFTGYCGHYSPGIVVTFTGYCGHFSPDIVVTFTGHCGHFSPGARSREISASTRPFHATRIRYLCVYFRTHGCSQHAKSSSLCFVSTPANSCSYRSCLRFFFSVVCFLLLTLLYCDKHERIHSWAAGRCTAYALVHAHI